MVTKRRFYRALPVLLTGILALGAIAVSPAVFADERDDATAAQEKAQAEIDDLKSQLEGIDSDLAALFIELEGVNKQVPIVQSEVDKATNDQAAAERKYQQVSDQLDAAQAESDQLEESIAASEAEEDELNDAVSSLARGMYRDGGASSLTLMMESDATGDIAQRAALASSLARAQNTALDSVRESISIVSNQAEKQSAVTDRISSLETQAADALSEAQDAKQSAEDKYDELTTLQSDLKIKQAEWDSKKSTAATQLATAEKEREEAAQKIAKIDEENRATGQSFAAPTTTTTAGGMFGSPLPVALTITSPFGWRVHPVTGESKLHNGTDFAGACGLEQYPIRDGVVSAVTVEEAGGNVVYINHGMIDGSSWVSAHVHLQSAAVSVGQQVDRSTVIGYTGETGYATGCHLHLSLMKDGVDVDPMDYL